MHCNLKVAPVKIFSEMTYNVSSGTLSLYTTEGRTVATTIVLQGYTLFWPILYSKF